MSLFSTLAHLSSAVKKKTVFWVGSRTRESSATGPGYCASCFITGATWSSRSNGAWNSSGKWRFYLEFLVALIGGSQRRHLGFSSKALPFSLLSFWDGLLLRFSRDWTINQKRGDLSCPSGTGYHLVMETWREHDWKIGDKDVWRMVCE